MGNEEDSSWMQDLKDAAFVIKLTATKLYGFRNDRGVGSSEVDSFILENEAKLIRLFSRLLYLKLQSENEFAAEKADAYGGIGLWLNIVNISDTAARVLKTEVKTVEELLQYNDSNLEELCDRCGINGEDRRRFTKATQNLKTYTKRWLDDKREPKDEFSDTNLCWVSYESSNLLKSPNSARDNQNRRSISESGVDSGASDSGLGSHPSQTSLPTASPPASPSSLTGSAATGLSAGGNVHAMPQHPQPKSPTSLFHWGTHSGSAARGVTPPGTPSYSAGQKQSAASSSLMVTSAQAKKLASVSGKAPTTPPPSLRWGTTAFGFSSTAQPPPGAPGHFMTRSRSHESNLPNRIIRADQTAPVMNATTPSSSTSAAQFILPLASHYAGSSMSPDQSSTFSDTPLLSPSFGYTSPTAGENAQSLQVPKSPRGAVRMVHNINHRFNRMWKPSMSLCCHCNKVIGLSGERCTDCKIKVHTLCKPEVGATCGLTPQRLRQIYDYIVQNKEDGVVLSSSPHLMDGKRSDCSLSNSMSSGVLSGDMPLSSSSSCTSSAPSTPAPQIGGLPQPSPSVHVVRHSKFSYPDVPEVTVEEANELRGSQGSDHTVHNSNDGSLTGAGSELTLSPEDNVIDSFGSNDSNFSNKHEFRRDVWSKSTIKVNAWREWTIPIEDIRFIHDDPPPRRGRFGEVWRAYWHQDVAVKFLNMDHVADEKQLETFKLEVSTFRSTRHENLVLFLGCCMNPPRLGIVMNWCRGSTLYTMLHVRGERLDMNKIINIAIHIAQGMSYLHGKKIIHKDLRSKNVFIEKNRAVITDFGLFSVGRLLRSEHSTNRRYLHVPEHWLCYLAPEIMRGLVRYNSHHELEELPFSNATDAYAFGTLWYELVTSEFPFKRQPPESIIWQVGRGVKPALNNVQAAKEVKDMMMQCWASKAADRHDFNTILKTFDKMPRKRLARSPSHPVHMSRSAEAIF